MLDISVLMWYIIARKDESNVLRKTPAPDAYRMTNAKSPEKQSIQRLTCAKWNLAHSFLKRNPSNREDCRVRIRNGPFPKESKAAVREHAYHTQQAKDGQHQHPAPHVWGENRKDGQKRNG